MCYATILIVIYVIKEKDKNEISYPVMKLVFNNGLCCGTNYLAIRLVPSNRLASSVCLMTKIYNLI